MNKEYKSPSVGETNLDEIYKSCVNNDENNARLLTPEEEYDLATIKSSANKEQAEKAKDVLILKNLRLVNSIVRKYSHRGVSDEDLIQAGYLGLIKAIDKFDYKLGNRLSTYATPHIKKSIESEIAKQSEDPIHIYEKTGKVRKIRARLTIELGSEPSVEHIAREMGLTSEKVESILSHNSAVSLDDTIIAENDDLTYEEVTPDKNAISQEEYIEEILMYSKLNKSLDKLDSKDKKIIELSYGINRDKKMTLAEIANMLGMSPETVRLRKLKAEKELRELLNK